MKFSITTHPIIILIIVGVGSIITTGAIVLSLGLSELKDKLPLFFATIAIMVSVAAICSQELQSNREEKTRRIERSLENFYRPLRNLFIGYEENPKDCYQNQKAKINEIGCYRHLAEKKALYHFEMCIGCMGTNDALNELLKQVKDDIYILQKRYDELNQP